MPHDTAGTPARPETDGRAHAVTARGLDPNHPMTPTQDRT